MTRLVIYINSDQITDIHVLYRFFIHVVKKIHLCCKTFQRD